VFFDNVYMYGKVNGAMTEQTPFNPCSRKGELRASISTLLLDEIKTGALTALIARAADFYGPNARTGVPNLLLFDKLAKGGRASLLASDSMRHSYTFTPDAAGSLLHLVQGDTSWNQTWHVPTAPNPPTGREFVELVAKEFDVPPRYGVLGKSMLRLAGIFDSTIRELPEMLYQSQFEYIFDSTKFSKAFGVQPTTYGEGVRQTAALYRR
jgi:nucleoside-diphosphate-sugar epimerase